MDNSTVVFIVDRELDIANYFIAFNAYKRNKERGFQQNKNEFLEKLVNGATESEVRSEIEKNIAKYYQQEAKLLSIADDINKAWSGVEKNYIAKLEGVHKFTFTFPNIKGVLSSAGRFGYSIKDGWFATDMFRNKYGAIDTATHELMHFMFHKYYDHVCVEKGLTKEQMWDVKESFTVLLNFEFAEFRFQPDNGYIPHTKLREVIKTSWLQHKDFDIALGDAIDFVKKDFAA